MSTENKPTRGSESRLVSRRVLLQRGFAGFAGVVAVAAFGPGDAARAQGRTNPTGGSPTDGGHRPPPYRSQLLCRTYNGDAGVRPLASGSVFYQSPDIWLEDPGGLPLSTPMDGVPCVVKVRVRNLGQAPSYATVVDLYWGQRLNPEVQTLHLIASQATAVMAGEQRVVSIPWTPGANGDPVSPILVVNVYNPITDPPISTKDPRIDRHVAEHLF